MKDINETLLARAIEALQASYSPYSKFRVAACIYTEKGNFYPGVNVENASYGLTLCAEGSAIANMVMGGDQHIQKILIVAGTGELCAPCGACRQRILEFSCKDTEVLLTSQNQIQSSMSLEALLPVAFKFKPQ